MYRKFRILSLILKIRSANGAYMYTGANNHTTNSRDHKISQEQKINCSDDSTADNISLSGTELYASLMAS